MPWHVDVTVPARDRSLAGPVAPDLDPGVREIHLQHSPLPDELGEQSKPDRGEQIIQRAGVFVVAPQVGGLVAVENELPHRPPR